jgi:hypothetical protein
MDDDDKAAEQHTVAADEIGATGVAPKSAEAPPDLAWSLNDDDETVSPERQSWRLAWAQAAVFAVIGVVLAFVIGAVGRALVRAHDDPQQGPSVAHRAAEVMPTTSTKAHAMLAAPSTVTVDATPPTVTVKATPPTVTVKAAAPTITIEAAPTTVTLPAPISTVPFPGRTSASTPGELDTTYDQRFLDRMRSLGYIILNPPLMLRNAHEACRLFRQGEAAEQVNQQMSAEMGTNMTDTLQLTSSAMLAYPDCY